MACDPNTLLNDARCFLCLTEEQRAMINVWLLCQILSGGNFSPRAFPGKGTSLINYWTLDETSGSRLNSVGLQALVPNTTTGFGTGKRGNAAGNNTDFMNTAGSLTVSAPMTFAWWTKLFTAPSQDHRFITAISPAAQILVSDPTNVRFNAGGGPIITLPFGALNVWHLIVITVDASNVWRASIDNSVFVSAAGSAPVSNNLVILVALGINFNGLMDEFAHWNVALTQADVAVLWNGGAGFFYDS